MYAPVCAYLSVLPSCPLCVSCLLVLSVFPICLSQLSVLSPVHLSVSPPLYYRVCPYPTGVYIGIKYDCQIMTVWSTVWAVIKLKGILMFYNSSSGSVCTDCSYYLGGFWLNNLHIHIPHTTQNTAHTQNTCALDMQTKPRNWNCYFCVHYPFWAERKLVLL